MGKHLKKMKKGLTIFILTALISFSCDKEAETEKCGCAGTKTETIDNIFGLVIETDDGFEILTDEKGLLIPCAELAPELKIDFQPVTISGQLRLPCDKVFGEFKITPIEITEISIRGTNYDKTDISLTVIKSEDYGYDPGFGYFIEDLRTPNGTRNLQPTVPAVGGNVTFDSSDKAIATALLTIYIVRGGHAFVTPEVLQYINVVD